MIKNILEIKLRANNEIKRALQDEIDRIEAEDKQLFSDIKKVEEQNSKLDNADMQ
jgi:hypothetical protein